jgi:hypothetical protein
MKAWSGPLMKLVANLFVEESMSLNFVAMLFTSF